MIEYRLRIEVPEPGNWEVGVSAIWDALSEYSASEGTLFALSLCPNHDKAMLVGSSVPSDTRALEAHVVQYARTYKAPSIVKHGAFCPQHPLGIVELAIIRDEFREVMFSDLACLMRDHPPQDLARLILIAEAFLLLDRIDWADDIRLWPLSLNGQMWAFKQSGVGAVRKVHEVAEELIPILAALERKLGVFDHDKALPEKMSRRIQTFQHAYDRIRKLVAGFSSADRARLSENAANLLAQILAATHTVEEARATAAHPNHMTYRIFMSLIYDLAPLIALSPSRRLIVFRAVTELLRRNYPALLSSAIEGGYTLRRPGS